MALVNYNATLEYATNTLKFYLFDDAGEGEDFTNNLKFNIERIDNPLAKQEANVTAVGNYATVEITPSKGILWVEGDSIYDYDHPSYDHIYSLKSNTQVYISGKLNLVEVAGSDE